MELSILMNMYNCNDWERLEHSEGQQITGIVPEQSLSHRVLVTHLNIPVGWSLGLGSKMQLT